MDFLIENPRRGGGRLEGVYRDFGGWGARTLYREKKRPLFDENALNDPEKRALLFLRSDLVLYERILKKANLNRKRLIFKIRSSSARSDL